MNNFQLQSTIICSIYHKYTTEPMPTSFCQYLWKYPHCKNNLKPKEEDCCIYCSHGDVNYPSIQKDGCC